MADIPGTTRAQTTFLRACTKDPLGLAGKGWPNAATFRRWMRRPTFRKAVKGIRDALRFQADLHLTAASAVAAQALSEAVTSPQPDDARLARQREQVRELITLLKLVHARERFCVPREPAEPAQLRPSQRAAVRAFLGRFPEHLQVRDALRVLKGEERAEADRALSQPRRAA